MPSDVSVPAAATVRLDLPTREALEKYMRSTGATFSQAVRILVALALREEDQSADVVFRAAALREGIRAGAAKLSERVQGALKDALDDLNELETEG